MINAFGKTLSDLFNPLNFVPGALLVLYQTALYFVFFQFFDIVPRFFYETLVVGTTLKANIFDTFGSFVFLNLDEIAVLGLLCVLWVLGFVWLLFVYTSAITGNSKGVLGAVSDSFSKILSIAGVSVFLWIILLLFFAVSLGLILSGVFFEGLQIVFLVLFALWLLAGFVIYLKLAFLPVVFFAEKKKIREALSLTAQWSKKKLLAIFLVILVTSIVSRFLAEIASALGDMIAAEPVAILVMFLALSVISSFSGLFFVNFYALHK